LTGAKYNVRQEQAHREWHDLAQASSRVPPSAGRFAHFTEEDIEFFQARIDEMWERWLLPGVIPFSSTLGA
jgi:hypothetical protein